MNYGEDIRINDHINVSTSEGEVDGNIDSNKDRSKDGEDKGNIVGKIYGIKDRIFKYWNKGSLERWNDRSENGNTEGGFISLEDGKDKGRTNSEVNKTKEGEFVGINDRKLLV